MKKKKKEKSIEDEAKEKVERELPEFFCVLGVSLDEVVNLTVFAFKEFMKPYKNYNFLNVNREPNKRYYKNFMYMAANLCSTIYEFNPGVRLKNFEYIKICLDFFGALHSNYQKRNLMLQLNGIHTAYAMEIFQEWCIKNFRSVKRYLELFLAPHKNNSLIEETEEPERKKFKLEKTKLREREIVGVKGLSEIVF